MNDIIHNLIDEPYNQNLDFFSEEDFCSRTCIEIIDSLVSVSNKKIDYFFLNVPKI